MMTRHTRAYFPSSFLLSLAFKATFSQHLRRSEPPFLFRLAFKAIFSSFSHSKPSFPVLGVQSYLFQFWAFKTISSSFMHLEPFIFQFQAFRVISSAQAFRATFLAQMFRATILNQAFRATFLNLGVQSHHFLTSVFIATLPNLGVQSHFLRLGIQSHFLSTFQAFRATISFQFGIQSHHIFQFQAFKTISSSFRRLEPFFLVLGIQSHFSSSFRRLESFHQLRCSEPPSSVRCSEPLFSAYAFKATSLTRLSEPPYIVQAFKATSSYQAFRATVSPHFKRSKPPFFFNLAFRAIGQLDVQSHHIFTIVAFKVVISFFSLGVQSHNHQFSVQSRCS